MKIIRISYSCGLTLPIYTGRLGISGLGGAKKGFKKVEQLFRLAEDGFEICTLDVKIDRGGLERFLRGSFQFSVLSFQEKEKAATYIRKKNSQAG